MSFGDAAKSFFTNYTNFKGRARRSELWYSFLVVFLVGLAGAIVDAIISGATGQPFILVAALCQLAVIIPWIAVSVRRLHDINKSGIWYFLYLIPFIGGIMFIVFSVQDTDPAANEWGQPAK